MNYSALIVAAGVGKRSGLYYNKVFYKIGKETVIEKSIKPFVEDPDCREIILVIKEEELADFKALNLSQKVIYVKGGSLRQESVYNGLKQVHEDYVMIHDGARPFLKFEYLELIKENLKKWDATLLMVKSVDTLKIVEDGTVKRTLDRSTVYQAQTPQAFKTKLIKNAYEKIKYNNKVYTDDVQVLEENETSKIAVLEGDYENIKITTKSDVHKLNAHKNIIKP